MNNLELLVRLAQLKADLHELQEYCKAKKLPMAVRGRLRALHTEAASIHYHLENAGQEPFWARLKGFIKGLA